MPLNIETGDYDNDQESDHRTGCALTAAVGLAGIAVQVKWNTDMTRETRQA